MTGWFEVNKLGLAKLLEKRGKGWAVCELIQNCWDENVTRVDVRLTPVPNRPVAILEVEDDSPEGFVDLSHAFTLYAESAKKGDPEKRGRFNLGEKLVLAICNDASIKSTKGTVVFNDLGRKTTREKREAGSLFTGELKLTRDELAEVEQVIHRLIAPQDVRTFFNGSELPHRKPLRTFEAQLPTEIADEEGYLRKTTRKTRISVYEVPEGEDAYIYEMGIPIVETGDKWHYDIAQKVPLNTDRDNVTPAYLRTVRTLVLNEMHKHIVEDDAATTWVRDAASDDRVTPAAYQTTIKHRFGDKVAVFDPSDMEANMNVVSKGYQVIKGAQLSAGEWQNLKRYEVAQPSGRIAPTAKAEFSIGGEDSWIHESDWTPGMQKLANYAIRVAVELLDKRISVGFINSTKVGWAACYGGMGLNFNIGRLGFDFFNHGLTDKFQSLLIHELAHEIEGNHLDEKYHDAICNLGAKLVALALKDPEWFALD